MASVTLTDQRIDIRFTAGERIWIRRDQLTIPLTSVRHVTCVDKPLSLARGARSGYVVSGFTKIGIWGIFGGPRQLVSARRGSPGLHLVLDRTTAGGEFDEVVLSDPAASELADAIRHTIATLR
ncbi:hypothetical protein GCM10027280_42880 [Micromonospora polyrhachis]|uniref:PH domain-containing protein n=1 Tax=Micromonospora polyrhachis TaxID=1282883 RepID=A0A7W7SWF2_9ACTN|nr:hypothetical protein [Micromonospora polyrhachis]MBB4962108.1 hypothetical protein [Micromonospora polyrhachis]